MMSNRLLCWVAAGVFLAGASAAVAVAQQSEEQSTDPSGTWVWEYDYGDGPVTQRIKLNVRGKRLFGALIDDSGRHAIRNGKFSEGKFSFNLDLNYKDKPVAVRCTGHAEGDVLVASCDITYEGETQTHEIKARRETRPVDVAGTWNLRIETEDAVYEPVLKIDVKKGKLASATLTNEGEEIAVDSLKLEDNILSFHASIEYEGEPLDLQFRAKPRGNKMEGVVEFKRGDDSGEVKLTGVLQPKQSQKKKAKRPAPQSAEAVVD